MLTFVDRMLCKITIQSIKSTMLNPDGANPHPSCMACMALGLIMSEDEALANIHEQARAKYAPYAMATYFKRTQHKFGRRLERQRKSDRRHTIKGSGPRPTAKIPYTDLVGRGGTRRQQDFIRDARELTRALGKNLRSRRSIASRTIGTTADPSTRVAKDLTTRFASVFPRRRLSAPLL
jgi:hypothetical protein